MKLYDLITKILIAVVKLYKMIISPLLPPSCRFFPTCSIYCIEALQKHGLLKGAFLAVKRILRCNPFSKGGFDPVP
jgi:putative membrane protein insertion efficiency factor